MASHAVEVVKSHRHLPLNNVKGVGSIPPPFNEALHQGSTHKLLRKKTNDRLEDRLPDIGLVFMDKKVVPPPPCWCFPYQHKGMMTANKKERDDIRFLIQTEFRKNDVLMQG